VVELIFGAVLARSRKTAIIVVSLLGLACSVQVGLKASLPTDVVQMVLFIVAFGLAFGELLMSLEFSRGPMLTAPGVSGSANGWVLLVVAVLQVFSYPAHDPVMMDRGFLADPETTRRSFLHAFWISTLCIIAFGFFGIHAGLVWAACEGELLGTWAGIFPSLVFVLLKVSLLVSALSTLDSALSSSARLAVEKLALTAGNLLGEEW
jgi:hypothetical protein